MAFCVKCGQQVKKGDKFCTKCGASLAWLAALDEAEEAGQTVQEEAKATEPQPAEEVRPEPDVEPAETGTVQEEESVQPEPEDLRQQEPEELQQEARPAQSQPEEAEFDEPWDDGTGAFGKTQRKRGGKSVLIAVLVLLVFAVALAGAYFAYSRSDMGRLRRQLSQGERFLSGKSYDRAEDAFQEAAAIDASNTDAHMGLGRTFEARANMLLEEAEDNEEAGPYLEQALSEFETVLELNVNHSEATRHLADVQTTYDEWLALQSQYEKILELLASGNNLSKSDITFVSSDVSEYPLVRIYLRVEDPSGDQVVLNTPKVAIRERISGGAFIEREVKRLQRLEGNEGLSIDLLADKSYSMYYSMWKVQDVMNGFVESLDFASGDQAELISFDSFIMYMCTYTDDVTLLKNGIENMTPWGNTALYDALMEGVRNAANQTGARCVIAFTDGQDNESIAGPDDVIRLATANEVPVYIIGAGEVDVYTLRRIAENTNGYYWDIDDLNAMSEILHEIYTVQKGMYCLEYVSEEDTDAYAAREITLALADDANGGELQTDFTPVRALEKVSHSSRYEIVAADISWTDANSAAISAGGHLATITTAQEMNELTAMAERADLKYIWIGGYTSSRDNNEVFGHWVTGEPFTYSAWYPGEPSRNDLDGAPEMYLMLWNVNNGWSWNDQRNDPIGDTGLEYFRGQTGYIIEYEE